MAPFKLFEAERENDLAHTILTRSKQLMRTRIAALPDGCYWHDLEIDGYLERVWLRTLVTVEGDEIEVNFASTSDQTATAAINASYNTTSTYGTRRCGARWGHQSTPGCVWASCSSLPENCNQGNWRSSPPMWSSTSIC